MPSLDADRRRVPLAKRIWLEAPDPESEAAFWEDQRANGVHTWRLLFLATAVVSPFWWMSDRFVFAKHADLLGPLGRARGIVLAINLLPFTILFFFRRARGSALTVIGASIAAACFALAYGFGGMDGPGSPWFPLLYPFLISPMFVAIRPLSRVFVTLLFAAAIVLGFFGFHPEHLAHPYARLCFSYLLFIVVISVATGLYVDWSRRDLFFLRRREARIAAELSELALTLESKIAAQTAELRDLATHLQAAQESERTRIARELHDELGQEMTALRYALKFTRLRYADNPTAVGPQLEVLGTSLNRVGTLLRTLVHDLRPRVLDDLGLGAALDWLGRGMEERTGIPCVVELPDDAKMSSLPADASIAIFRVAQEALTNAAKHAAATQVELQLQIDGDDLVLTIEDDGVGLPASPASSGMGIVGMRERIRALGGTLSIEPGRIRGTRVRARIAGLLRPVSAAGGDASAVSTPVGEGGLA